MHLDWSTLVLQTVNVLVLLWLLRRFLFRPIVAIIAERKAAAETLLADAAAEREAARDVVARAEIREKAQMEDRDRALAEARGTAEAERAGIVTAARAEADQIRTIAEVTLQRERTEIRRGLEAEARDLAVVIASRLLTRAAVDWIDSLPDADLAALTGDSEPVLVTTAEPLDAANQARLRTRLTGAVLRFETDASLIHGVELTGPHARYRNNWRADLERIGQELKPDDTSVPLA